MAKLLVELGADISSQTVLASAISVGDASLVALLLDEGANPNVRIGKGNTPLHAALFTGRREIARLLLSRGARTDLENDNGVTAKYLLDGMPELAPEPKNGTKP